MSSSNAPEENKANEKPQDDASEDALDDVIDAFEKPDKLNLTADEKDDDEKLDPETEKEFQDFMKNLTNNMGGGQDDAMNQLGTLLNDLMGSMGGAGKGDGKPGEAGPEGEMMKKAFEDMMKNVDNGDFENVAQNLLKEFMDKEILYEPLKEAQKNYENYFEANKDKIKEDDRKNYQGQYECIVRLISICETDENNKEEMIKTFESMHEYGMPPEGILNPLQKINPGLGGGGMPNMNDPGCNIF